MTIAAFGLLVFWTLGFFMLEFSPLVHAALMLSAILFLHSVLMQPGKSIKQEVANNLTKQNVPSPF